MPFGEQKKDLGFYLIEQATGLSPDKFLKLFRNLPANKKNRLISQDDINDGLRILAAQSDTRADDILQIITEPKFRNQRIGLYQHYSGNGPLQKFSNNLKKAFDEAKAGPKLKGGRSQPVQLTKSQLETFARFYNSKNPFLMQQIKSKLGANDFGNLQKMVRLRKLIDDDSINFYKRFLEGRNIAEVASADMAFLRAGNILKKYKQLVPKATGSELRAGTYNFGYIDVIKLFETDPILKAYLNAPSRNTVDMSGNIISGPATFKTINDRKNRILTALKLDGTLDELGLGNVNLRGSPPKLQIIDDPKVKAFIKEEAAKGNPNLIRSNMVNILDEDQKNYFDNFLLKFRKEMYDQNLDQTPMMREFDKTADNHANRATDLIRNNFSRYMRFALMQGKSVDDAFNGFKKQIEKKDFIKEAIPILYRTEKLRDNIKYNFAKYGIEFPQVSLSHQARVIDHIDQAFKTNNLFTGFRKLNAEENALQLKIDSLKRRIQQRGGAKLIQSDETLRNLKNELDALIYELDSGGYYDPVPADFEDTMKQAITDISTAGYGLLADGGFASIEDVLDYRNG